MNATAFMRDLPASPILSSDDHWLFDGPGVDPFCAHSPAEAEAHAYELNSDRQRYAVVRFNAVDGLCRDVSHEFVKELPEEPDEDEDSARRHIAWMRNQMGAAR